VFHVEDIQVPVTTPSGEMTVRVYSPEGIGPFPVHLNFHGGERTIFHSATGTCVNLLVIGGWVLGGLKSEAA
jgi:acetyl esterase/lipase